MADNDYYQRLSEMNPGELADGLALEAEFDAIARGFGKLPTPHRDGQGFEGPVRVGDAANPDEAINKKQLDETLGTAKQLPVATYGNFNAAAWGTLPSGTYLLFGTGSQITNSPFTLVAAKTYYFAVRHAIGDNLYCDSLLMASLDDSAHADIGREAWRSGPTLAVASAGWKAAVFKSGDTVTGDILGVTAPQFANDKKFATTEFVQRALGNFQTHNALMSNTTLTAAHMGRSVQVGNANIILPAVASVPVGSSVKLLVTGTGTLSVSGGVSFVVGGLNGNVVASWVMVEGDEATCVNDGSNWLIFGSMSLKQSSRFAASLAGGGYQKLPSGLIIQWGGVATSDTSTVITYPIAFPNAVCSLTATSQENSNPSIAFNSWYPISKAQCKINANTSGFSVSYIAIGY